MPKRHEALKALSHHHHHALVIALKLIKAGEPGGQWTVDQARRDAIHFWEEGGNTHFREEEEVLLPAFAEFSSVDEPEIKQMLIDHVVIRSWMGQLSSLPVGESITLMRALGERLQQHVRLEERIIFPKIEEVLSDADLKKLKPAFHVNDRSES